MYARNEAREEEKVIAEAFLSELLDGVKDENVKNQRKYLALNIVPCLVPAIVSLLKAVQLNEERRKKGEEDLLRIEPTDYLAKYLYRHNPRHCDATPETKHLQELAERLCRISHK